MSNFMQISKRVLMFVTVNILVILTLSLTYSVLSSYFGLPTNGMFGLIIFGTLFGFGGALISLFTSKWMAKKFMGVQVIDPRTNDPELRKLVETVHQYSRAAGLKVMPEVGVYNSPEVNAFATGPSKSNSLVAVSVGLMQRMKQDEVDGVLAHEVAHIANGDMVTMTLIQGVINAVVLIAARLVAQVITSAMSKDGERSSPFVYMGIVFALEFVMSILGAIVVNYFSRAREYRADAGGARVAGREKMVNALRRLQSTMQLVEPEQQAFQTLKISSGNKKSVLYMLFATHPPLEDRIRRLETGR
jgi:heat shock protein HtpX